MSDDVIPCPACGGAGGGPFGRAGSAWDLETYECPRCEGGGFVAAVQPLGAIPAIARPLAKGPASSRPDPLEKRGPVRTRPAVPDAAAAVNDRSKR